MCIESNNSIEDNEKGQIHIPSPKLSPLPGEIWEVNRYDFTSYNSPGVVAPVKFSLEEQQQLYSDIARDFLNGMTPSRYVMIVNGEYEQLNAAEGWEIASVMLLSEETGLRSDIDLVVPGNLSGLQQDLLAQTGFIMPMLSCNLSGSVGKRLSRKIYDLLMDVGDYYHYGSTVEKPNIDDIQDAGLKVGRSDVRQNPEYQIFCDRQKAWSDVLTIPVSIRRVQEKGIEFTRGLLEEIIDTHNEISIGE